MDGSEDRINLDTVRLMKALYGFQEKKLRVPGLVRAGLIVTFC